ncbi:hypothetical protein Aduo_011488 [Ancylostoma duodenale]
MVTDEARIRSPSGLKLHQLGSYVLSNRTVFSSTAAVRNYFQLRNHGLPAIDFDELVTLHDVNMATPSVRSLYRCILGLTIKV